METPPRICVVVPVYNHGGTVQRIVRESRRDFPVIVVDDGSTDQGPAILAQEHGITLVTLPANRGKAAALRAGFAKAGESGYTHAITIDADGQHPTDALAEFAAACREQTEAVVIGIRDLKAAGAPLARRISNALSTFCFRLETGVHLADTQCGYRAYPLAAIRNLRVDSDRYAFELEIMVKAAWAGIPLRPQRVHADYSAPTSRLSHFHPLRDFFRIFRAHARLAAQALCVSASHRKLLALGESKADRMPNDW
jgi:glycosyltransferase involved in cell wall biosynthesis